MTWWLSKAALLSATCLTAHGHVFSHGPRNGTNWNGTELWSNTTFGSPHQYVAAHDDNKVDIAISDRHGKERGLYHLTNFMAQRGRDRILSLYPDFARQCSNDADCALSLEGIPDSVSQKVLELEPAQRGEKFDATDFWEHASGKGVQAEMDSAIRTLIVKEGMSTAGSTRLKQALDDLYNKVKKEKNLFNYLKALEHQRKPSHHKVHSKNAKKAMRDVNKKRPMSAMTSKEDVEFSQKQESQPDGTFNPAGTLFLRSLIGQGICHGDAYLCDRPGEDLSESSLLKLLRIGTMDGVLPHNSFLKNALIESLYAPDIHGAGHRWPYKHFKHEKKHNKGVKKAIEVAVKQTRTAAASVFLVNPLLRHTMEVFDPYTGQLTPATVMPYVNKDAPQSPLKNLGYLRYFSPDARSNGPELLFYSRLLDDVTPVLSGSWMLIPADSFGLPPANTSYRIPAANNSSLPSGNSTASGNSTTAWMNGGVQESLNIRVIQAMRNYKGDVAVDSMGQPKLRSVSWTPGLAQMMAVDSVNLQDQAGRFKDRIAIRPLRPDGTVFGGHDGHDMSFEFIPGKHPNENALSVSRQVIHFHREPGNRLERRVSGHLLTKHRLLEKSFAKRHAGRHGLNSYNTPAHLLTKKRSIATPPFNPDAVFEDFSGIWRDSALNAWTDVAASPPPSPVTWPAGEIPVGYSSMNSPPGTLANEAERLARGWGVPARTGLAPGGEAIEIYSAGGARLALEVGDSPAEAVLTFEVSGRPGIQALIDASTGVPLIYADGAASSMAESGLIAGGEAAQIYSAGGARLILEEGGTAAEAVLTFETAGRPAIQAVIDASTGLPNIYAEGAEIAGAEGAALAGEVSGVAGIVSGVTLALYVASEIILLGLQFTPDYTCPMRKRYTEMWNQEIATATWFQAPCETTTTAMYSATQTTVTISSVSGASSVATPSAGTPMPSNGTVMTYIATVGVNPTSTSSAVPQKTEAPCERPILPSGFDYQFVAGLRCPVPMAYECTIDWFHQHVNQLPAGRRNPNYCHNGDLSGHYRALDMGCLPDFKSDKCKKEFDLKSLSYKQWLELREE